MIENSEEAAACDRKIRNVRKAMAGIFAVLSTWFALLIYTNGNDDIRRWALSVVDIKSDLFLSAEFLAHTSSEIASFVANNTGTARFALTTIFAIQLLSIGGWNIGKCISTIFDDPTTEPSKQKRRAFGRGLSGILALSLGIFCASRIDAKLSPQEFNPLFLALPITTSLLEGIVKLPRCGFVAEIWDLMRTPTGVITAFELKPIVIFVIGGFICIGMMSLI